MTSESPKDAKTGKGRSRDPITSDRVDQVIGLIDRWRKDWVKLTGENLAAKAESCLGFKTTRPALLNSAGNPQIREAYDKRVEELYGPKKPSPPKPVEGGLHEQRLRRLQDENDQLRKENDQYKQRFIIWLGNARRKNLTEADLNAPLPSPRPDKGEDSR